MLKGRTELPVNSLARALPVGGLRSVSKGGGVLGENTSVVRRCLSKKPLRQRRKPLIGALFLKLKMERGQTSCESGKGGSGSLL